MMSASATYIDRLDPRIFTYIQYGDYADRYPAHTAQAFPDSFYEELRAASRGLFQYFHFFDKYANFNKYYSGNSVSSSVLKNQ